MKRRLNLFLFLLSVSSIGSEAMQPGPRGDFPTRTGPFSILNRIGGDATTVADTRRAPCWSTFSILNRIGGDATMLSGLRPLPARPFSILNRIGGDATQCAAVGEAGVCLAFSILNRIGGDATAGSSLPFCFDNLTFSILNRIGGDATKQTVATIFQRHVLSVSSIGSEAMQLNQLVAPEGHHINFQYPQSDRRRCNRP